MKHQCKNRLSEIINTTEQKQYTDSQFAAAGFDTALRIMIMGPTDCGKTYLCHKILSFLLRRRISPVGFFDLDIGQSSIGPPGTIGYRLIRSVDELEHLQDPPIIHLGFIGALTPYGNEGRVYSRIKDILRWTPTNVKMVIDTTGYRNVTPEVIRLKCEKIKIISPDIVILISCSYDNLIRSLNKALIEVGGRLLLWPSLNPGLCKSVSVRRAYHLKAFGYWLDNADFMVFPAKSFNIKKNDELDQQLQGKLVGLLDGTGRCVGGGIFICNNGKYITVYGTLRPGDKEAISLVIGKVNFKPQSWKIVYEA